MKYIYRIKTINNNDYNINNYVFLLNCKKNK